MAVSDYPLARFVSAPGAEFSEKKRLWQGVPSIAATRQGTLYLSWYSGGEKEPDPENYHLVVRSFNSGRDWSHPCCAICSNPGKQMQLLDVRFWCDPPGRLWLFWSERHYTGGFFGIDRTADVVTWASVSDDPDAPSPHWSTPRKIGSGDTLNIPTVLSDGRWLLCTCEFSSERYTYCESCDQGKTWQRKTAAFKIATACDESMIVETAPQKLDLYARTLRPFGRIALTRSSDNGRNWGSAELTGHKNAASRFWIGKLRSGRLLLVNTDHESERTNLTAFLSEDGGRCWPYRLLLDSSISVSYPDVAESPDGRLFICYDFNRNSDKMIFLSSITEAEILAGKITAPDSFLRKCVSAAPPREDDKARMIQTLKDYQEIDRQWTVFCREHLRRCLYPEIQTKGAPVRAALN